MNTRLNPCDSLHLSEYMHPLDFLRKIFPIYLRYFHRYELRGLENLPCDTSAIIAPNHSGGWDMDNFALMSCLEPLNLGKHRRRIHLCYWDYWDVEYPYWAPWVKRFSPIPIGFQGGGKGIPYNRIDPLIESGELIAIYPEGHSASIKEGYRLWRFYPGVIRLHLRYKIPIIPTANIGFVKAYPILSNEYNPTKVPGWEKEKIFPLPLSLPFKLITHFGKPISFPDYFDLEVNRSNLDSLALEVRKEVAKLLSLYN